MKRETRAELAEMLAETANMAYLLTLGGVPPWMAAIGKRMREPQDGDLVFDTSTAYGRYGYAATMRVGHLMRTAREKVNYPEWNEATDGPHPTEKVWYIRGLDGVEHRWTNAAFVAIPKHDWQKTVQVDEEEVRRFQARP